MEPSLNLILEANINSLACSFVYFPPFFSKTPSCFIIVVTIHIVLCFYKVAKVVQLVAPTIVVVCTHSFSKVISHDWVTGAHGRLMTLHEGGTRISGTV